MSGFEGFIPVHVNFTVEVNNSCNCSCFGGKKKDPKLYYNPDTQALEAMPPKLSKRERREAQLETNKVVYERCMSIAQARQVSRERALEVLGLEPDYNEWNITYSRYATIAERISRLRKVSSAPSLSQDLNELGVEPKEKR